MAWGTDGGIQGWATDPESGYKPPAGVGPHGHNLSEISTSTTSGATPGMVMLVYPGMTMLWYGAAASCPSGWAICDGTNGTPDMRGRVPVGVDTGQTEFDVLGEAGGAKTHTLSLGETPAHAHGGNTQGSGDIGHGSPTIGDAGAHRHYLADMKTTADPNHTHVAVANPGFVASDPAPIAGDTYDAETTTDPDHSHSVTIGDHGSHVHPITSAGSGSAHANLQPYRALHFIMKL